MKYENEYKQTETREAFIRSVLLIYKHIKLSTVVRRYYDLRKAFGKQMPIALYEKQNQKNVLVTNMNEEILVSTPSYQKLIIFKDMRAMGYKITDGFLKRYGFSLSEINWLKINKYGDNLK